MSTLLPSAFHYLRLAFHKGPVEDDAQRRYVGILRGIFSGLVGRGIGVIVSLISIPLTVRYLGAERYGAWVTISAAMAWIALADLGLGSSLTNAVSEGYAKDRRDVAQHSVAAAFWSLAAVAALLSAVFFSLWATVPWDRVFNVATARARAEVGPAVAIAFAIFALNFPFSTVSKIYGGYQEVAVANGWAAAGNIIGLAALIVVTQLHGGLIALVIAVSGALLLTNVISAVWVFGWSKPWLFPDPKQVSWDAVRKLASVGGMFFVIQIAWLVLFQTDNLIIAHYLGAAAVTPYSVTWRLFACTTLFQVLASPSYWPAYAEAFSRGDRAWVRRSFRMNFTLTVTSTMVLALPLVIFGRRIIEAWAGAAAVPPAALLLWMAVWNVIYAATSSQSCVLAGSSRLRGQMTYSMIAAVVNIAASILLVQRIGITGAILGTIISYAVCLLVPQWLEVKRALEIPLADPLQDNGVLSSSRARRVLTGRVRCREASRVKVAVDTLFLGQKYQHTGTFVYLKNVLHESLKLCEANPQDMEFHGFVRPEDTWNQNGLASSPFMRVHRASFLGRRRVWFFGGMAIQTMRIRPDLVFLPTGQHSIPAPLTPVVTTILDAIPRRIPSLVGRGSSRLHLKTWLNAKVARKIITISLWSKRDLVELYDVDPTKIEVTYLGYDKERYNTTPTDTRASTNLLDRFKIRQPFILHHGMVQLRKNVHRLIEAWDSLREQRRDFDVQLVLAGPMGFGHEEILRRREASSNRDEIVVTGALADDELAALVKSASVCVIPSLYEGFCLPLVEAMACGIPTVASNSSCIPEVSGGVLEYFDPLCVDQMAGTIMRVFENFELRRRLSEEGVRRVAEFSWQRCAKETLDVFSRAVRADS